MNDSKILILVKLRTLAIRIKKALENEGVCVVDIENENKFISTINNTTADISMVILDLEVSENYAYELVKEVRKKLSNVPIILLSSGKSKKFYVNAMLNGATDFVVKPFNNQTLVTKVLKYLNDDKATNVEFVTLDLNRFIKGELKKASKGNFPISLMFLHFDCQTELNIDNYKINAFIFENIQDLFWDTDVFIRFASKYYLGVFPFCDEKNTKIITEKLNQRFIELQKENEFLENYTLISKFVSYPFDTNEHSKVYNILIDRINQNFNHIQLCKSPLEEVEEDQPKKTSEPRDDIKLSDDTELTDNIESKSGAEVTNDTE